MIILRLMTIIMLNNLNGPPYIFFFLDPPLLSPSSLSHPCVYKPPCFCLIPFWATGLGVSRSRHGTESWGPRTEQDAATSCTVFQALWCGPSEILTCGDDYSDWFICNFRVFGKSFGAVFWRCLSCFRDSFRSTCRTICCVLLSLSAFCRLQQCSRLGGVFIHERGIDAGKHFAILPKFRNIPVRNRISLGNPAMFFPGFAPNLLNIPMGQALGNPAFSPGLFAYAFLALITRNAFHSWAFRSCMWVGMCSNSRVHLLMF